MLDKNVKTVLAAYETHIYYEGTVEEWTENVESWREPYAYYDEDGVFPDDGNLYWHYDESGLPVLWEQV